MNSKWAMTLVLVLAIILTVSGCGDDNGADEVKVDSAEDIIESVIANSLNVETYSSDSKIHGIIQMSIADNEGQSLDIGMEMAGTILNKLDNVAKEMVSEMQITAELSPELETVTDMDTKQYLVDGVVYVKTKIPGESAYWIKQELPEEYWADVDELAGELNTLQYADVQLSGSEVFNGTECYLLDVKPSFQAMWDIISEITGIGELTGLDLSNPLMGAVLGQIFEEYYIKMWVAKDTFLFAGSEVQAIITMDSEKLGVPSSEGAFTLNMDVNISATYYDYNKPVVIELPEEAANAVDVMNSEAPL